MFAGAGETISVYNDPQIKIVDTGGGGAIRLRMGYTLERFFRLTTAIAVAAQLTISETTRARKIKVKFTANADAVITLWAATEMDDVQYTRGTRAYVINDAGDYTLESWWDGVAWNTTINGPQNT